MSREPACWWTDPEACAIPPDLIGPVERDLADARNAITSALRRSSLVELARELHDVDVAGDPLSGNVFARAAGKLAQGDVAEHLRRACRLVTWALHSVRVGDLDTAREQISGAREAVVEHTRAGVFLVWVTADDSVDTGHIDDLASHMRAGRDRVRVTTVLGPSGGNLRWLSWTVRRRADGASEVAVCVDQYTTITAEI